MLSIYTPASIKSPLGREAWKIAGHLGLFGLYLALTCAFYCTYEGWSISETIMFSLATMTTIGYGYKQPKDDSSRLFTIFSMIIGVFLIFASINDAVVTRLKNMSKSDNILYAEMTEQQIYRYHQRSLAVTIIFIIFFLFLSAGIFCVLEDWTFIEGLYFSVQTATTIGYGDMVFKEGSGANYILGFYMVLSTTLLVFAFNNFRTLHEEFSKIKEMAKFAEKKQTLAKLKELDQGQGVPMDKFILAVLVQLGKLDQATDIDPWIKKFRELDTNNSGTLDSNEIEQFSRAEAEVAVEQLESLRLLTAGTDNVAWASINDVLNLGGGAGATATSGVSGSASVGTSSGTVDRQSFRSEGERYYSEATHRATSTTHNALLDARMRSDEKL